MDKDISEAVRMLNLSDDVRSVAESVAREICRRARAQIKANHQAPHRAHVRDRLKNVAERAEALRKALRTRAVAEALVEASLSPDDSDTPSKTAAEFDETSRLLSTLPDDLLLVESSARAAIDRLKLGGQLGSVKAPWTYRPTPDVVFVRSAMDLWKATKGRLPSEKNAAFLNLLAALVAAAGPAEWRDKDWRYAIRAARSLSKLRTVSERPAYAVARWEARAVVRPLVNAIRDRKRH